MPLLRNVFVSSLDAAEPCEISPTGTQKGAVILLMEDVLRWGEGY